MERRSFLASIIAGLSSLIGLGAFIPLSSKPSQCTASSSECIGPSPELLDFFKKNLTTIDGENYIKYKLVPEDVVKVIYERERIISRDHWSYQSASIELKDGRCFHRNVDNLWQDTTQVFFIESPASPVQ